MADTKRQVPNLRFKGFTDDWEQHKLGEVVSVFDGTHQTPNYKTKGIMFLSVENINTLLSNKYISENEYRQRFKIKPQYLDVFMTRIGTIGKTNVITTHKPIAYYVSLALLRPQNIQSFFLSFIIQTSKVQQDIWKRTLQIAFPQKINKDEIGKVTLALPLQKEQIDIEKLLLKLDKLITLQQRKLDLLNQLKKGLLQKMFADKDSKQPILRFNGFTDDWEQRKLEDISIINPKSVIPEHFKYVDLESVVGTDLISFIETDKNSAPSRAQRVARTGDIFYQTVRPYQKNNYLFTLKDKDYVFSTGYAQIRSDVDNAFLMSYLQNENFVQTVLRHSTGTSYPAISPSDLAKISVFIPKKQKEQLKIGKTFSNIDNLITLHQRKQNHLKLLKKSLLQQMFM